MDYIVRKAEFVDQKATFWPDSFRGRGEGDQRTEKPEDLPLPMKETLSGEKLCPHIYQDHPFFFYAAYFYALDSFKIVEKGVIKPLLHLLSH
jgi:hypothetical protein